MGGGDKPWPQLPVGNEDATSAAVVIIGAGMGGMCQAIELIRRYNYHNFVILEKGNNFGGTWLDNKYPGCCCDIWSTLYSFSFEQNSGWTREYPGQEEMLDYLISVAQKYNLYKYVRFNSEVKQCTWNDSTQQWNIDVSVNGGKAQEYGDKYTIASDFVVSAIGQLNRPYTPKLEGLDTFAGKTMHTARWDWTYDLRGKRVGVIGSGATAIQVVPELVDKVSHLTVYQRSPHWVTARDDKDVPEWRRTLYRYIPYLQSRVRGEMMNIREDIHQVFQDSENSPMAKMLREQTCDKLKECFPTESDHDKFMREELIPKYTLGCKRICVSDDYYPSLAKPNVTLETRGITSIGPNGPIVDTSRPNPTVTADTDLDVLILATGYQTMQFLAPMEWTGRNGRKLKDIWADGPRALYGVTVEDLPNFGMLYGPNTNLGHSSIELMLEAQSRYIGGLAHAVLEARKDSRHRGAGAVLKVNNEDASLLSLSPKRAVVERYENEMQERLSRSPFADPNCSSWYKDPINGKITNNWPGNCVEFGTRLSKVEWDDYEGGEGVKSMRKGQQEAVVGRVKEELIVSDRAIAVMGLVSAVAGVAGWYLRGGRGAGLR